MKADFQRAMLGAPKRQRLTTENWGIIVAGNEARVASLATTLRARGVKQRTGDAFITSVPELMRMFGELLPGKHRFAAVILIVGKDAVMNNPADPTRKLAEILGAAANRARFELHVLLADDSFGAQLQADIEAICHQCQRLH